jgi:putative membrane protein
VLVAQWVQQSRREAARIDRQLDRLEQAGNASLGSLS